MNTTLFFAEVRAALFGGSLSQSQVDGLNALLAAWDAYGTGDKQQLAYCALATPFHETAATMQPIEEIGHGASHPYGRIDGTGQAPYGRGYVQLTWASNYQAADAMLGLGGKLARNYSLALDPTIAAQVLIGGMLSGLFTGEKRKLSVFVGAGKADYVGARAVVNGRDRAQLIAGYAVHFEAALTKAGYGLPAPQAAAAPAVPYPPLPKPVPNPPAIPAKPVAQNGALAEIGRLLVEIFQVILTVLARSPKS